MAANRMSLLREGDGAPAPRGLNPWSWLRVASSYLWHRLAYLLMYCDTEFGEILAGLLATGWGCFILFSEDPAGDALDRLPFVPSWAWGVSITALGLGHLGGVLVPIERLRRTAAYVGAPVWAVVAVLILWQAPAQFGYWAYGLFTLTCAWIFIRRGMDDWGRR